MKRNPVAILRLWSEQKFALCEKEPISDYPASQFITGVCTKISYTLANLLRPTIRLITLIILTEQNTGQSMGNWLELFEENLRLRNLLCFYQGFVISLWLTLNRKCVLHGLNEWVPQAFHHLHLPQFLPHLLGKAIRFNVHAVYAVYGSLWLGKCPSLVNPGTTSEWWRKTTTGAGFHYYAPPAILALAIGRLWVSEACPVITWSLGVFSHPYLLRICCKEDSIKSDHWFFVLVDLSEPLPSSAGQTEWKWGMWLLLDFLWSRWSPLLNTLAS